MKKLFLSLLLCSLVSTSQAQTVIDTLAYRFIYDVQAKTFENNYMLSPDEHWLDIGKKGVSNYYSIWKDKIFCIIDILNRIGAYFSYVSRIRYEQGIES